MSDNNQNIAPIDLLTKHFANEANAEEKKQLEAWRLADPENQKEFEAFSKLWNITADANKKEVINIDAEWEHMEKSISSQTEVKTINLFSRVVSIAASIMIISTLAFFGLKQMRTTSEKATITASSEIVLPDGSNISLNVGSRIIYEKGFGETHRNITLKGEAFFDISKNAEIPFIIKANEASIEVIGTQFNVKAYKKQSQVKVLVTEGKVQLFDTKQPEKKTLLVAGEAAIYDRKVKVIKREPDSNQNDIAWKTRIIDFNNAPLNEVVKVLSNTYHYEFIVDPLLADCPITVRFEDQDIVSVLKVLKSTLNLTLTEEKDRVLKITGEGCD